MRVDVRPGVLGLAMLGEDAGGDLVDHVDELEDRVIRQVLLGVLVLRDVARIGLAEHGVAVARDDLAALERVPEERLQLLLGGDLAAQLLHHVHDPAEHLLVREAVERAREAVQAGGEGVVRVGQRRGDEVRRVRRDVPRLVVRVEDEVHARDLVVRLRDAHHVGEVGTEVELGIGRDLRVAPVLHPVDVRGDARQLRQQVHRVFVHRIPVVGLLHALGVAAGEDRVALHREHRRGEHRHGMRVAGHLQEDVPDVLGHVGAAVEAVAALFPEAAACVAAAALTV